MYDNNKEELIEQMDVEEESKLVDIPWHREKFWETKLLTITHGMNSLTDLHNKKKG